jgi:hypothetical protein
MSGKDKIIGFLLILTGLLQCIGYIIQSKTIKGIGAATAASPLPIVFTEVKGVETFASAFILELETSTGEAKKINITPEIYSGLNGPYNRRNVYGAAFAYGPVLPDEIWRSVLEYGFCKGGTLARELGLNNDPLSVKVHIISKTKEQNRSWFLNINCRK